jgi:hypothetical protein
MDVTGGTPEEADTTIPRELTLSVEYVYVPGVTPEEGTETVTIPVPLPGETLMPDPATI